MHGKLTDRLNGKLTEDNGSSCTHMESLRKIPWMDEMLTEGSVDERKIDGS